MGKPASEPAALIEVGSGMLTVKRSPKVVGAVKPAACS